MHTDDNIYSAEGTFLLNVRCRLKMKRARRNERIYWNGQFYLLFCISHTFNPCFIAKFYVICIYNFYKKFNFLHLFFSVLLLKLQIQMINICAFSLIYNFYSWKMSRPLIFTQCLGGNCLSCRMMKVGFILCTNKCVFIAIIHFFTFL